MYCIILPFYIIIFTIHHGEIHWTNFKNSQSQLSISSLKAPVSSSSESQTSSAFELTTTSITCATYKHQNKYVFVFPKYHLEWCNHHKQWRHTVLWDTKKQNYNISTISTPNHHSQRIASTSSSIFNYNTHEILGQS